MSVDSTKLLAENDALRVRIVELEATVKALRIMLRDLGGLPQDMAENMYEDEAPLVVWEGRDD